MNKRISTSDHMKHWMDGLSAISAARLSKPDVQTVNWNPGEYKVVSFEPEKGELKLRFIEKEETQ